MAEGQGHSTHKFVIVLNKRLEPGVALNACAHMVAALVARATEEQRRQMMIVDYLDADNGKHPISGLSLIVLRADNSNQIERLGMRRLIDRYSLLTFWKQ